MTKYYILYNKKTNKFLGVQNSVVLFHNINECNFAAEQGCTIMKVFGKKRKKVHGLHINISWFDINTKDRLYLDGNIPLKIMSNNTNFMN